MKSKLSTIQKLKVLRSKDKSNSKQREKALRELTKKGKVSDQSLETQAYILQPSLKHVRIRRKRGRSS